MKNGMLVEVKNLGVPVQHPSQDSNTGYVLRWSSDPQVSPQAPAHIIIGSAEFQRFVKLALPEEFLNKAAMVIHPVVISDGQTAISRNEAIKAGASSESWDNVRSILLIVGKSGGNAEAISKEWYGSRDDFFAKQHIIDASDFAKAQGITAPVFFTSEDVHKMLNASNTAYHHLLTMNPALRTAKLMTEVLERSLSALDLNKMHPDRAMHVLNEIQQAAIAHQEMKSNHNTAFNLDSDAILGAAPVANPAGAEVYEDDEPEVVAKQRVNSGMSLH